MPRATTTRRRPGPAQPEKAARAPRDRRGSFAPADLAVPAVRAFGSSNVADFAWQPLDPDALADFLDAVARYGSAGYAALAHAGNPDGVLAVTFLGGATYQYAPVPLGVFVGMLNADSRGSFVWGVLRDYPFVGPV